MILDFLVDELDTQHGDFYHGVPIRHRGQRVISSQSSVAIVGGTSNLGRAISRTTRAVILMTPDSGSLPDMSRWNNIPVFIGQKMKLPRVPGKEYSGDVFTESSQDTWGHTSFVREGEDCFLVPTFPSKTGTQIVPVPDGLDIEKIHSDLNVRMWLLGHIGLPERLRISKTGRIAVNPTK